MNIKRKLATGIMTGALCTSLFVSSAFAKQNDPKGGNVTVNSTNCAVQQTNNSFVLTGVNSQANTGNNTANNNGGKKSSTGTIISTGGSTSAVQVAVTGSGNSATNPCCGCAVTGVTPAVVDPHGNNNTVTITSNSTTITQTNNSAVVTVVNSQANTGGNNANNNSKGPSITTGDASSAVSVSVGGSMNTLN
jgi:hypothetical protein